MKKMKTNLSLVQMKKKPSTEPFNPFRSVDDGDNDKVDIWWCAKSVKVKKEKQIPTQRSPSIARSNIRRVDDVAKDDAEDGEKHSQRHNGPRVVSL